MSAAMSITETTSIIPAKEIEQLDKHGYLFGQKLAASMSPMLHQTIYGALSLRWEQLRLDSTDMPLFLEAIKHPDFYGASVTMPHKVAIIPHLDEVTDECREVGACNTIFVRESSDGRRIFCGANTDTVGVRDAFLKNVPSPEALRGRPGMVIGGGGAARSAVYALRKWLGVTDIYIINREKSEVDAVIAECANRGYGQGLIHVESVEQAEALEGPGASVACVPDFPPRTEAEKLARSILEAMLRKEKKGVLLEMCYNPTPYTEIWALAQNEGWEVILGTEALIWQGLEQDKYWTGLDTSQLPTELVREAVAKELARKSRL